MIVSGMSYYVGMLVISLHMVYVLIVMYVGGWDENCFNLTILKCKVIYDL